MIKSEIKPLTGIRTVAALWVVFYHLRPQMEESFPHCIRFIKPLISQGYLGVDLFFILSGFIIHYNYSERLAPFHLSGYGEYLWMRLARIWPVHMAILLLYGFVLVTANAWSIHPAHQDLYSCRSFLWNVILVHAWSIPIVVSWNAPAWSISCEWLVYLLFPLFLLFKLNKFRPSYLLLCVCIALIGTPIVCDYCHSDGNAAYGIIRVIGEFFGGCGLCLMYRLGIARDFRWQLYVPLTLFAMIAILYFGVPSLGLNGFWCIPFLGAIVIGLAHDRGLVARFFSMKLMLWGGYISYSIYMVHAPCLIVIGYLKKYFHLSPHLEVLADLLVIILMAALMFRWIEEPCRKAMRKAYPRHKQQPYPVI